MKAFIDPDLLRRLRIGPLATYFDSYLKRIEQEGFLPSSVPMQMYAIARFSKWLHTRHLEARMVDETVIDLFLKRQGEVRHGAEPAPLRRLLAILRESGVTAAKLAAPVDCQKGCIAEYHHYLVHERGLSETSVPSYVGFAEQFLSDCFNPAELHLSELTPPTSQSSCEDMLLS
jgi:hypothetical protein